MGETNDQDISHAGGTNVVIDEVGTPTVVTGLANPTSLPNPNNNRLTSGMRNGEMLYASGLRIKWATGNGW